MQSITDIFVVYNDKSQIKRLEKEFKDSSSFHFIDSQSQKGRREAFRVKSHWAAREEPFVICENNKIPVKAFYSESGKDVIQELINYIKR